MVEKIKQIINTKTLFIALSILFAIPSIIYLIQNKSIVNFESSYQFLLTNNISRIDHTIIFFILFISITILYFGIIKKHKELFKNIKNIIKQNPKTQDKLYRITNLGKNDSLKAMKDGKTFWGAINKSNGSSKLAQLKEVNSTSVMALDPTVMMMSVALSGIESQLVEIKELNKKILSFFEDEKESEIESDLEILNRSINDFKFNLEDEKYLVNNHKQVMDIKRTANKNMLFYKKQIKDYLSKNKIFTTSITMNSIISEIEKKLKYYRLSLYIYSFSSLMEILLLGNYQSDYLLSKKEELDALDNEYTDIFNNALSYIKKNANRSLEGNVLSGLGNAGKVMGSIVEKGENLKQTGQNIKDNFVNKFDEIKQSNSKTFINQIEKVDCIYNKTKEIYFDNERIYLEME